MFHFPSRFFVFLYFMKLSRRVQRNKRKKLVYRLLVLLLLTTKVVTLFLESDSLSYINF